MCHVRESDPRASEPEPWGSRGRCLATGKTERRKPKKTQKIQACLKTTRAYRWLARKPKQQPKKAARPSTASFVVCERRVTLKPFVGGEHKWSNRCVLVCVAVGIVSINSQKPKSLPQTLVIPKYPKYPSTVLETCGS